MRKIKKQAETVYRFRLFFGKTERILRCMCNRARRGRLFFMKPAKYSEI